MTSLCKWYSPIKSENEYYENWRKTSSEGFQSQSLTLTKPGMNSDLSQSVTPGSITTSPACSDKIFETYTVFYMFSHTSETLDTLMESQDRESTDFNYMPKTFLHHSDVFIISQRFPHATINYKDKTQDCHTTTT